MRGGVLGGEMRGGAHVKEALGVVTLLWNHPVLTGLLLLIFTPPFFPLVVYFSPLLMSTALCVVALVSVGSQMEKIKAEGGPGQQLESHLRREHGVSSWVPPSTHDQEHHRRYAHRNLFNVDVVAPAAPTPWRHELPQLPVENDAPSTPPAEDSEGDWWDNWVKEYESRPGWGEQEDQQPAPTPATTSTIPTPRSQERPHQDAPPMTPRKPETTREEKASPAPPVVVSIAAPVVSCRQEVVTRSLPPPPPPTPRNGHEKVVKESDLRPHVSLARILTGKVTRKAPEIAHEVTRSVNVERVSDAQALQSIEKLLAGSNAASEVAHARNVGLGNSTASVEGEGVASTAYVEKSKTKVAVEPPAPEVAKFAGESPPLLRHLKISQAEKAAYSPLPARASKGLMSEKVLPPPQFSPLLLQSLQPLPPKGFSPRLPNLSSVPLGNPVEKIPQWVYDGIPRERTERTERAEEKKNIRAFEQAVRELSESRRKKNARRPSPIQVGLQSSTAEATLARIRKQRTPSSRVTSPAMAVVEAETLPTRNSEDMDAPPTAPSPRAFSPSAASPQQPSVAVSPRRAASRAVSPQPAPIATSPRPSSPQPAPIAPSPRPASPQPAPPIAASPRPSSPRPAPIAASPRPSSPQPASIAPPPRPASPQPAPPIAASPRPSSPRPAPIAASPRPSSPQPASIAPPPRPASPQPAPPIAASPRPSSPRPAPIAASPRPSSPQPASIAPSPRPASPQPAPPIAASPRPSSPRPAPIAASPRPSSPHPAPIEASLRPSSAGSSPQKALVAASPRRASSRASSPHISCTPWPASTTSSSSPQKSAASPTASSLPDKSPAPASPSVPHYRRRRQSSKNCTDKVAFIRIEASTYYDPPSAAEKEKLYLAEEYVPIEEEPATPVLAEDEELIAESHCISPRTYSATRKSRRRLEPRRVVTSADTDMFSLKKSFSTRTGETKKFVDSSSSSDDERELSVTPRASSRRGSMTKPLVWRSRSHHAQDAHDDSD